MKTHRPQTRAPEAPNGVGEPVPDHAPWGNAAAIEALNGGGEAGPATNAPTPEAVLLMSLRPRGGIGADAQMGVAPGIRAFSPFDGLQVQEHFGPARPIPALFSAEDLTDHPDAPDSPEGFVRLLDLGDEGVFTVDCLGQFTDHHHGGGLPISFQGWLTPGAFARGIGYEFDQTYTANGEEIGSFVVRRVVGARGIEVDKVGTGASAGVYATGRTPP